MFSKSNNPVYWTNRKTLKLVTKQPSGIHGIEGEDWEWQEIDDKSKKISFWQSHDYYFDLDAVREPHITDAINKLRNKSIEAYNQSYPGGHFSEGARAEDHELGKNPGDVFDWKGHDLNEPNKPRISTLWKSAGVPRTTHPKGKTPGDFWEINTQPFPEAHFAVFPEKLCEKPIKAGCPEEVCKKCGKARERITEKHDTGQVQKMPDNWDTDPGCHMAFHRKGREKGEAGIPIMANKTIGWTSCKCNAGFEGGILLDPFCGAGTALYVAKEMRRRYVGIDIKKEFKEMSDKRLAQGVL